MEQLSEKEQKVAEKILPLLEGLRADEIINILFSVQQHCASMYVFDIGEAAEKRKKENALQMQSVMQMKSNDFMKLLFIVEHLCNNFYQLAKRDMGVRVVIEFDPAKKVARITSKPHNFVTGD